MDHLNTYMTDLTPHDEFTYFVYDTLGGVDTVTTFISINPINDEPVSWPGI